MKRARSALVAAAALAGSIAAIQGGMVHAEENIRFAQLTRDCHVTVAYRDDKGEARTKTTCVKGGEAQCNNRPNNFCAPIDQPDIISRTCKVVPSCPDTTK